MNDIRIRLAQWSDRFDCAQVLTASIRELCIDDHKNRPEVLARWLENKTPVALGRWIRGDKATLWVAQLEAEVAGVGAIDDGRSVLLNYVSPRHRFRGVSRALLAHMEDALRASGVLRGTLTSSATAHRFYRDAGWVDIGSPDLWLTMPGFPMEKDLRG